MLSCASDGRPQPIEEIRKRGDEKFVEDAGIFLLKLDILGDRESASIFTGGGAGIFINFNSFSEWKRILNCDVQLSLGSAKLTFPLSLLSLVEVSLAALESKRGCK